MDLKQKEYSTQVWTAGIITLCVIAVGIFFYSSGILADDSENTIGTMATHITATFTSIGKLIIATSYLAGLGFSVSALFKFKQHKDNPQQVPIGTPIALLIIGAVMIFLPLLFSPAGQTIFGSKANSVTSANGFEGSSITVMDNK